MDSGEWRDVTIKGQPLERSSGGGSCEQAHKTRSCVCFRRGGCLLGALGHWVKGLKAPCSVHCWWGLLAFIEVPRLLRDEPTCRPAGEQSVFSSASLLWPPTTWGTRAPSPAPRTLQAPHWQRGQGACLLRSCSQAAPIQPSCRHVPWALLPWNWAFSKLRIFCRQ